MCESCKQIKCYVVNDDDDDDENKQKKAKITQTNYQRSNKSYHQHFISCRSFLGIFGECCFYKIVHFY